MTKYYQFDCGCKFEVINESPLRLKFEPDIEKIPLDCPKTWDLIKSGNTISCFQIDSQLCRTFAKKIQPSNIRELSDLISLVRPGTLEGKIGDKTIIQHYIDRKNKTEEAEPIDNSLIDTLKDSYQLYIYQEDVMKVAKIVAGFDDAAANKLRKGIGKKLPELIAKIRIEFIEGAKRVGIITEEKAELIFDAIEASARYLFNKSITEDTIVELENGNKKTIKNINIGDKINTIEGYSEIINKYDHGIQDVYEITLENGNKIKCTMEHKFLCEDQKTRSLYEILEKKIKIICKE